LELIPFLIWRKTGTKDLKTIKFLELHGRVLRLVLSRYVSDSVLTIVKICWRGIYRKSFRVQQSSVDTRLVNFLVNRNVFLLLLVEICAIFKSFFWSSKNVHSRCLILPFTVTNLFGFPTMISLQHAAARRYV